MALEEEKSQMNLDEFLQTYAADLRKQWLRNLEKNGGGSSVSFSRYTQDQIYQYLQSPQSNETNLRNTSIYFYNTSSHYRRLIDYYATMMVWDYIVVPYKYDPTKVKAEQLKKQYVKAIASVETMNLKNELKKALTIALREGVAYCMIWTNSDSWWLQRINPDICVLSSVENGAWNFAVDCSRIKEEDLNQYPEAMTTMWNEYRRTGTKYQEVPAAVSFCLKADETTAYSLPPFAATIPLLYYIETAKELQEIGDELNNYKLISLTLPTDKDGKPSIDYNVALKYYDHFVGNIPPRIGVGMTPMKMESVDFERSGSTVDVDSVARTEEQYWAASGTSSLLFGSAKNSSSSGLKLSITSDEALAFGWASQCERLINRYLLTLSGTVKFKITILPVTVFNRFDMVNMYKEAATYGIARSAYGAALGFHPADVAALEVIDSEVLSLNELTPLTSTHTQSSTSDTGGRPTNESKGEGLTEAGEQTKEDDENANR